MVIILPPSLSTLYALQQLQHETEHHATLLGFVVAMEARRPAPSLERVETVLRADARLSGFTKISVIGRDGEPLLRIGEMGTGWRRTHVTVRLPESAAPFTEVRVEGDAGAVVSRGLRVLAIHLFVAAVLAFAVYRLPLRSLRHAIDEVKTTQVQLQHSAKLVAIGEIYAGLAHEINNPLGIILSRVRLMRAGAGQRQITEELARDLEMIERHGSRIAQTVRSLLAFSRKTPFELGPTDLNEVVQDAVALVQRPFARQAVTVVSELEPRLPSVRGSRDHLQQVFLNLLTNARDAMPDGGMVTVRTYARNGTVVGEVQDAGTGMPPEVQARVFEPFFTTKREGHGTGLGLSVSANIVSAHGGEIAVESAPGHGACFRVRLPAEVTAR
ncbi:MAG: two-component sensor histidine kinase [Candidatus Rokubacteria bacterium]|nr:two-component sensor histidine kinase [Candidatus Rokubacteria bacterium]